jgi:hypothetical protein
MDFIAALTKRPPFINGTLPANATHCAVLLADKTHVGLAEVADGLGEAEAAAHSRVQKFAGLRRMPLTNQTARSSGCPVEHAWLASTLQLVKAGRRNLQAIAKKGTSQCERD